MWKILAPVTPYILGASVAVIAGLSVYVWLLTGWLDTAKLDLRDARAELATCAARVVNIQEDMESDATVDDPRNFDVPERWLMPSSSTGSN